MNAMTQFMTVTEVELKYLSKLGFKTNDIEI